MQFTLKGRPSWFKDAPPKFWDKLEKLLTDGYETNLGFEFGQNPPIEIAFHIEYWKDGEDTTLNIIFFKEHAEWFVDEKDASAKYGRKYTPIKEYEI